ncbi:MAG: hypothetical protein M1819_003127 [Sarea resinae]|nr:MAG: hypothetical protein M1819_003127 [Sarea resinae]
MSLPTRTRSLRQPQIGSSRFGKLRTVSEKPTAPPVQQTTLNITNDDKGSRSPTRLPGPKQSKRSPADQEDRRTSLLPRRTTLRKSEFVSAPREEPRALGLSESRDKSPGPDDQLRLAEAGRNSPVDAPEAKEGREDASAGGEDEPQADTAGTHEAGADHDEKSEEQRPSARKVSMGPPSAVGRANALRKPAVSVHPRPTDPRTHKRVKSTASTTNSSRIGSNQFKETADSDEISRPPSSASISSSGTSFSQGKKQVKAREALPGTSKPQRAASTTGRHMRTISQPNPSLSKKVQAPSHGEPSPKVSNATRQSSRLSRAAFSTLQQHYSPKKPASKTITTNSLPSSTAAATPLSPETYQIQTELLQLHLLHQSAAKTHDQWESSARGRLRELFTRTASDYRNLREAEQDQIKKANLVALSDWASPAHSGVTSLSFGLGLPEKAQLLGQIVTEISHLTDQPGGRFTKYEKDFAQWVTRVQDVWGGREGGSHNADFLEGLGSGWHTESLVLERKLISFVRDLEGLGEAADGSSLAAILTACRIMAENLRNEIGVMQDIEREIMASERRWIEDGLRGIADEIGGAAPHKKKRGVWSEI